MIDDTVLIIILTILFPLYIFLYFNIKSQKIKVSFFQSKFWEIYTLIAICLNLLAILLILFEKWEII